MCIRDSPPAVTGGPVADLPKSPGQKFFSAFRFIRTSQEPSSLPRIRIPFQLPGLSGTSPGRYSLRPVSYTHLVRIGSQVKQIVSGIKAHYTPEEMVGKKVMVLVNLKPAKLAGVLSEGMILCAEDAEGNLALMTPEKPMPAGAEIC